jgi:hypothetical protein
MAENKAKRSIQLMQPKPRSQSANLMPVKAHIYRSMAEMNAGFEQAVNALRSLQSINFLPSRSLNAVDSLLSRIRAQANCELMAVLNQRESTNTNHFRQLGRNE